MDKNDRQLWCADTFCNQDLRKNQASEQQEPQTQTVCTHSLLFKSFSIYLCI